MEKLFFDSWESLFRSTIITILAYLGMIIILRISGKRTLSKMNAYDFIVTVALGSSMASVALNKNVTLADGLLVFMLFILLQYLITKLSLNNNKIKKLITNQPTLLLYKGELLQEALRRERITKDELFATARKNGILELKDIDAIILESTGDLTLIRKVTSLNSEALNDVEKPKRTEI